MAYPQIVYDAGAGNVTLDFTFPPIQKPGADDVIAEREDSITSGGLKQSVWERNDWLRTLQMDFVPQEDLPYWRAFFIYALTGGEFTYYPDADDAGTWDVVTLEDQSWKPKKAFNGFAKFSFTMRLATGS